MSTDLLPLSQVKVTGSVATAAPRWVTSFTASVLNPRLNFRIVICNLQFPDHDLIFVSTEPAAAHPWARHRIGPS